MYTDYFGLTEPPFSLTPDPRYLFMSERHREGLAHLFYGVQQPGGFVQLTGEIGSGKTTLSRCLVRQLPPETDVALILNPRLTALELLATVCDELRIPYPAETESIKVLIDALNTHLLESHARHRRTVLIIDEAQNLNSDVLEQIRLLTNLETSQEKLLQIILIGQPELLSLLKRKELRQLAQRITARYHLMALSRRETYAYIHHRLVVAGRRAPLFTNTAVRCVYRLSGGVPRLINIICDRALLGAYARDRQQVGGRIVRRASRETQGFTPGLAKSKLAWIAGIAALIALTAGSAIFFSKGGFPLLNRQRSNSHPATVTSARTLAPAKKGPVEMFPANSSARATPREVGPSAKQTPPALAREATAAKPGAVELRLSDLLSSSSQAVQPSSFSELFARWGLKGPKPGELGCKAAQGQGLDCLFIAGNWPKLRRYDLPAILELVLPNGMPKRVTLVGLNHDTATLAIGGREYGFPVSEIDKLWAGSCILLWKPPFAPHQIVPGAQGDDVVWVRRALDTLDKKPQDPAVSELYDDALRERVLKFQRDRSLIQDGLVGTETLVRLGLALHGPDAPSLSKGARP